MTLTPEERKVVEAAERWLAWLETDSEEYGPEPSVEQLRTLLAIAKRADAPASEEEIEWVAKAIEQQAANDWASKIRDNWLGFARAAIDALRRGPEKHPPHPENPPRPSTPREFA